MSQFGYIYLYKPEHADANTGGYIFEHRLVVCEHIKRRLDKHEIIHHLNGDRQDNRLENLGITNRKTHLFIHFDPKLHSEKIKEIRKAKYWSTKKN